MDIKEFHPGRKVYVKAGDKKVYGTAGNAFSSNGIEIIVRFDDDQSGHVVVTEKNVHLFHSEPLN